MLSDCSIANSYTTPGERFGGDAEAWLAPRRALLIAIFGRTPKAGDTLTVCDGKDCVD